MDAGRARVVFGSILMLVGALFLAERFEWWGFHLGVPLWPIVLIALGLARSRRRSSTDGRGSSCVGVWLVLIGCWGLLNEWGLFSYDTSWPILIAGAGSIIVWHSLVGRHAAGTCGAERRSS